MNPIVSSAINSCRESQVSFCKFVSSNDVGSTGAHQSGYYIPQNSYSLLFSEQGVKGENKDKIITIKWQDDFETTSRCIYYGRGTRNEYRLTRFGKNFPFLQEDYRGSLLIIAKMTDENYNAYVIFSDEDIEDFLAAMNISATDTNCLLPAMIEEVQEKEIITIEDLIEEYINNGQIVDFPETAIVSQQARRIYNQFNTTDRASITHPDKILSDWLETEYKLFKAIENKKYAPLLQHGITNVDELVLIANSLLNRRKSRAGKSLEHHLAQIFIDHRLSFTPQAVTENRNTADFIFPSQEAYHNRDFATENLIFLGAKTTCKDRWRQILSEGERTRDKHLFTLQSGISGNQLEEMRRERVTLVVPRSILDSFDEECRPRIKTLSGFINFAQERNPPVPVA